MCLDVFKVCIVFECIIVPVKLLHPSITLNGLLVSMDKDYSGKPTCAWQDIRHGLCGNCTWSDQSRQDRTGSNRTMVTRSQNSWPNCIVKFKHTIVTQSLTSASVSLSPTRYSFPVNIFSTLSRASNTSTTPFSYAAWLVAKPVLYTPSIDDMSLLSPK